MEVETPILSLFARILPQQWPSCQKSSKFQMEARLEPIIAHKSTSSFTAYRRTTNYFDFHWHYHPEFELTLIEKGQGTRLVGDHTASFTDMDLVLLGSNLPHTWVSESEKEGQSAIVIQFSPTLFSDVQFNSIEFLSIKKLFGRSSRGLFFNRCISEKIFPKILELLNANGLYKLTLLWLLLDTLSQYHEAIPLTSPMYQALKGKSAENPIDIVCQYIHEHFMNKITLDEIAKLAGLTPTSFCRFFKKMTGMTFIEYLNELRVSRAQKLLLESQLNINEVAFQAGFESITHFNRIFLRKNKISPRIYRNQVQAISSHKNR